MPLTLTHELRLDREPRRRRASPPVPATPTQVTELTTSWNRCRCEIDELLALVRS